MEIVPGLHQIVLPVPAPNTQLNEVNAYLVEGRDGWLLVDTGWNTRHTFAVLEEQLGQIGVGVGDISQILITHFHPDHYGLVGKLKQLSPAKVALHEVEIAFIESRYIDMDSLLAEIAELLRLHGVPEEELPRLQKASLEVRQYVLPFSPEIGLRGGETIAHGDFNFEVIWTPGHSPGHVCLYEPKHRILLSGDHLLPTIFSNIALHPQSGKDPLRNYLSSLSVIEQLDVGLVLPAHEYVFAQPGQRIKEIRRHHQERKAAIINFAGQVPTNGHFFLHLFCFFQGGVQGVGQHLQVGLHLLGIRLIGVGEGNSPETLQPEDFHQHDGVGAIPRGDTNDGIDVAVQAHPENALDPGTTVLREARAFGNIHQPIGIGVADEDIVQVNRLVPCCQQYLHRNSGSDADRPH